MALEIADTLDFLLGAWTIERTIEDSSAQASLHFSGTAQLTRVPAGAVYAETGQLSTPTHTGPARRTLGLRRHPDGTVGVDFEDGRPFFELDLSTGTSLTVHPCGEDTYEMAFAVLGADTLRESWRVRGPDKDYDATTHWRRR